MDNSVTKEIRENEVNVKKQLSLLKLKLKPSKNDLLLEKLKVISTRNRNT